MKCVKLVQSQTFWESVEKIVGISEPFVVLLQTVDTEKLVFGKVYWLMSQAINVVREYNHFSGKERTNLKKLANARWTQMHTPMHGLLSHWIQIIRCMDNHPIVR